MSYTKNAIVNDGGQQGGDAILENMQHGIGKADTFAGLNNGARTRELTFTTALNYSANTAGADVGIDFATLSVTDLASTSADDYKVYDPQNCSIVSLEYFTTSTGVPKAKINFIFATTPTNKHLDTSICGELIADIDDIVPVDNTTTVTIAAPAHGIPIGAEGVKIEISSIAGLGYSTLGKILDTITDADTVTILACTLAQWNIQIAKGPGQHIVCKTPLLMNAGGTDYSTDTTLRVVWKTDITHPTFLESVFGDA